MGSNVMGFSFGGIFVVAAGGFDGADDSAVAIVSVVVVVVVVAIVVATSVSDDAGAEGEGIDDSDAAKASVMLALGSLNKSE